MIASLRHKNNLNFKKTPRNDAENETLNNMLIKNLSGKLQQQNNHVKIRVRDGK